MVTTTDFPFSIRIQAGSSHTISIAPFQPGEVSSGIQLHEVWLHPNLDGKHPEGVTLVELLSLGYLDQMVSIIINLNYCCNYA